jgi:NADP-dependent 3-hydroxy acid dehydrogenase YdfG
MSATKANVRELVRSLRHLLAQSNIKISGDSTTVVTLCREDIHDLYRALKAVEDKPVSRQ